MKKLIMCFTLISLTLSCNTTEPPPPDAKPTLNLELEDVSSIEAWINLTTTNLQLPITITLKQNNTVTQDIVLSYADTLLYIDSLLPNTTYSFHAITQSSNQSIKSNELSVTTMDTTSHNFTWQTFTFGEHSSSVLYDVAIIDENNIWAVGEIYMNDSLGNPDPTFYNAVHWNGQGWELKRIFYGSGIWTIRTIFAFNANDIWFSAFVRYDGQNFIELPIPPILTGWSINKIWGSSSEDLYVVGNNGNIAHYNGVSWTKIESGTELNINDIWGDYNNKTGEWEILAVASNKFFNEGKSLLKIDGLIATGLNTTGLPWSLSSVWFKAAKKYMIGGDGLFFNKIINDKWNKDTTFITIYKDRIRGIDINDIVVSGSNGLLSHFNGLEWKHYINNELPYYSGRLLSSDIKDDLIIAVGWKDMQAIITIGRR